MLEFHLDDEDLSSLNFGSDLSNFKSIEFQSRSELACAVMMQRYIRGWKAEEGKTFQVPLAQNRRADFMINSQTIFEYHPISLHREMISDNARRDLERHLKHCKQYLRDTITDAIKEELYYQYFSRRQILVKATPGLESAELIVAYDSRGFYRKVIQRFSDEPPALKEFHREWNNLVRNAK